MSAMRQAKFIIAAAIILGPMAAQADPLATWFDGFNGCGNANAPCFEAPEVIAGSLTGNVPPNQTSGYVPPDGNNLWSLRSHSWLDSNPAVFQVVMTADWIVHLDSIDLTVFNNDCQRYYWVIFGCVGATWGVQTSVNGGPFGPVLATFGGTAGQPNGVSESVSVALIRTLNPGDFITLQVSVQDAGNAFSQFGLFTGQYHFYDISVNGTVLPSKAYGEYETESVTKDLAIEYEFSSKSKREAEFEYTPEDGVSWKAKQVYENHNPAQGYTSTYECVGTDQIGPALTQSIPHQIYGVIGTYYLIPIAYTRTVTTEYVDGHTYTSNYSATGYVVLYDYAVPSYQDRLYGPCFSGYAIFE